MTVTSCHYTLRDARMAPALLPAFPEKRAYTALEGAWACSIKVTINSVWKRDSSTVPASYSALAEFTGSVVNSSFFNSYLSAQKRLISVPPTAW
jgi:predicted Rdx family selenoprotein